MTDGVVVPPDLCRALSRLAVLGLREQSRRDGGVLPVPGLAAVLAELSACGHVPATVDVRAVSPLGSGAAASVLGLSPRSARRLAAAGRLRAVRTGRDWAFDRQAVEDLAAWRRRNAA
jgi:excisionase family DNA binding protein